MFSTVDLEFKYYTPKIEIKKIKFKFCSNFG